MKNLYVKILSAFAKTAVVAILITMCFAFSACDPSTYYFKSEDLADVVKIELINYDNPKQKHFKSWVPDHTGDLKPFDLSKTSNLEILDENKKSGFIESLCQARVMYKYFAYDSAEGICIKLNYANDDFLIVGKMYICKFSSEGEVSQFFGAFSGSYYYETLINNYFQTQV